MHLKKLAVLLLSTGALAACGGAEQGSDDHKADVRVPNNAPPVAHEHSHDSNDHSHTADGHQHASDFIGKPGGPVAVAYRIIGQPVVGQPVAIEVRMLSALGSQPINVGYRINDATAMQLAESQPEFITVAPVANEDTSTHQVTIVPLREGRLYLNVSASIDTVEGTMSTVTAIPIQVGEGGRDFEENGVLDTDENGEAIRSLPAND